jgi:microcin C transport system permease protein
MAAYILKRLLLMIPTLFGVLLLTFVVIQFVPGGPVEQMVSQLQGRDSGGEGAAATGAGYRGRQGVDAARIAEIKALYGFDKPAPERFWQMLKQFARFDLGKSFFYPKDVWSLVKEKLPVSISLGLWTFFLSYLISVPLGIAKAVRAGSRFDALTSLVVLVGYAIPGFVLGVALLVIFGGQLQWFPLRGLTSSNWEQLSWGAKVVDYLWHITLPITASVLGAFAVTTMLTKNAFLEEIRKQYVLTARAKGLSERRVLWKHVFRNALDSNHHRLSGGLHRRVLRRLAADRDPVLAGRSGAAELRVGDAARLPGGAGHAVPVHADRAGHQAHQRPLLRLGGPACQV